MKITDSKSAVEYIHSISWNKSRPGLSRTRELLDLMGNPEKKLKFIHIVGTNGKGSTAKMLSTILTEAGYKTGLYVSPYVIKFNERIQLSGEMISDDDLTEITEFVRRYADTMEDHPTEFELVTAIGFEYFYRKGADIVVLEAGMGGLLDSTNIIPSPELVIVTEIGLDHTGVLGNTIEEIAETKSGVIKKGTKVLSFATTPESECVISRVCGENKVPLYNPDFESVKLKSVSPTEICLDVGKYKDLKVSLTGEYQKRNVAAVVAAVEILRENLKISDEALYLGLRNTVWHGRFEKICDEPLVITDGGHNPQGIRAAVDSFKMHYGDKKALVVFGVMADKDVGQIVSMVCEIADEVITVTPDNPRAASSEFLKSEFLRNGVNATEGGNVDAGLKLAFEKSKGRIIFALGSLYMYPEIKKAVEKEKKRKAKRNK